MALRRMFSLEVVNTDAFLDLPHSAQCLYFHLGMHADDDGFLASPRRLTAMVGCTEQDLQRLIEGGLVLRFPSGICVIRHWKVNNLIKKDRYKPTNCVAEKQQLQQDETGAFLLEPNRNPTGTHPEPQDRLGKDREGQEREESAAEAAAPARRGVKRTARGPYGWIRLSDEEYHSLLNDLGETEVERCIAYVDESAQATGNKNQWRDWNLVLRRCHRDRWGLSKTAAKPQTVTAAAGYDDEDSFI